MSEKKIACITGATSGIGKSCAFAFAGAGFHLILTGRRRELLNSIKRQLEDDYSVQVLTMVMDVRDRQAVESALSGLEDDWKHIDVLVNNAGLALGLTDIGDGDPGQWDQMIDTNIKGLLYVSRCIIPGMINRQSGHIINIGSIAGREAYPKGNVYCATKSAVDALSRGMRMDLLPHGIKVSQVSPGATETEFSLVRFQGDEKRAKNVYSGFTPLEPDDIAQAVLFVASLPSHANVDDLLIMPTRQANATMIYRQEQRQ